MALERDQGLSEFNVPPEVVRPLLSSLRLVNGAADALFYDVGVLYRELSVDGDTVVSASPFNGHATRPAQQAIARHIVNLDALADPEGVILVIDAQRSPYVTRYDDVKDFLARETGKGAAAKRRKVKTVTLTGVGSSALGSAAFAWNVSSALDAPVAAIVPGYGLADILPQALGGWFGFGVEDFLRRASQQWMECMAPGLAASGRALAHSAPAVAGRAPTSGALPFLPGCPESDILHAILRKAPDIVRLYGHSKGVLAIENALRGLPGGRAETIAVTTFGCAIAEETGAVYEQILGCIDALGQVNSWGNFPEHWIGSWHTTNTLLPLPMPIETLTEETRARR